MRSAWPARRSASCARSRAATPWANHPSNRRTPRSGLRDLRTCTRTQGAPGGPVMPGGDRARRHRQGRRPALRPGRAGGLPAAAAARRPAGRAEPAAGRRVQHHHPGRDPPRGHPARPALPVARRRRQPAAACQVHHVKHKANGGNTSLTGCVLLCSFHHQVAIHRWGWTLVLNPDGTTTAWNKDKTGTKPRSCTATGHPPGPGNTRCCVAARCGGKSGPFPRHHRSYGDIHRVDIRI
jgi:hypothetical protein